MQNLCSEKRKNVCKTKYMFEEIIDKQMYVRYNRRKQMFVSYVWKIKFGRLNKMNNSINMITEGYVNFRFTRKRAWLAGLLLFITLIIFSTLFFCKTVTAQRNVNRVKMVTSIQVQEGDTLWSIASRYYSDEYNNMNTYIDEIRDSNGLSSDTIHTGNYIIVPYYEDKSSR